MNILIANWTWYPSGGDWTYIENLRNLYEQNGHNIIPFSMKDERNYPTEYSKYFIENIDYKELNNHRSLSNGIKVLIKSIYSVEAKNKLQLLLNENKVDLVHLNIIHRYLTPSILSVIKKNKIPVIWTIHDYTILCPESIFVNNGVICEKCIGGHFYHCAFDRCKKKSYMASMVAALENYLYRFIKYYSYVDYFIFPSKYLFNKFILYNFYKEKMVQIYHCYELFDKGNAKINEFNYRDERYVVFVGRLENIKGVYTLLKAMINIPDIRLKIIGDGSQEKELKMFKDKNNIQNVEFLGKMGKEEVLNIIRNSEFLICPSEWFEVLGFVNVEAMLMGKPVIGSRIGAIPETVIDGETGLLFEPGNYNELSEKIKTLYYDKELIAQYGQNAKSHICNLVSYENHFNELKKIVPNL